MVGYDIALSFRGSHYSEHPKAVAVRWCSSSRRRRDIRADERAWGEYPGNLSQDPPVSRVAAKGQIVFRVTPSKDGAATTQKDGAVVVAPCVVLLLSLFLLLYTLLHHYECPNT